MGIYWKRIGRIKSKKNGDCEVVEYLSKRWESVMDFAGNLILSLVTDPLPPKKNTEDF